MSAPAERHVQLRRGGRCRIWEKGSGFTLAMLGGGTGYQRWSPFLERLAAHRRVVLISQPGYPGSDAGFMDLDDTPDWIAMTLDLLEAAGVAGADLIGESVGGMLAAEAAAFSPQHVGRLILLGPMGLYDDAEPVCNPFAQAAGDIPALLSANLPAFAAQFAPPTGDEAATADFEMLAYRAAESASRLMWPFGDRGLAKRLHRIRCPTLLIWGSEDRVVPASYAKRFAAGIAGPTAIRSVEGAGHLVSVDAPEAVAEAILNF